jgi:hypothetical protein
MLDYLPFQANSSRQSRSVYRSRAIVCDRMVVYLVSIDNRRRLSAVIGAAGAARARLSGKFPRRPRPPKVSKNRRCTAPCRPAIMQWPSLYCLRSFDVVASPSYPGGNRRVQREAFWSRCGASSIALHAPWLSMLTLFSTACTVCPHMTRAMRPASRTVA